MSKRTSLPFVAIVALTLCAISGAFAQTDEPSVLGDPTRFTGVCLPLPAERTPYDGDPSNDDGWVIVDFCAGGVGDGAGDGGPESPAQPPGCHRNDDDSAPVDLGFEFDWYGTLVTSVWVNNNGNVSFDGPNTSFEPLDFPVQGSAMIAPFWGDVDTGREDLPDNRGRLWLKRFEGGIAFAWDNVGYSRAFFDFVNTFQLVLSDGSAPGFEGSNVAFCYDDMQWTTGQKSAGSDEGRGFGEIAATVGINAGDGERFELYGRFAQQGDAYDGPGGERDGIDHLDGLGAGGGAALLFDVGTLNVPPVPGGFPPDSTDRPSCGVTYERTVEFASPEPEQTTTIVVDDPDGAQQNGLEIGIENGNVAQAFLSWIPDEEDVGNYLLTFTATDDAKPAGETVEFLSLEVTCAPLVPIPSVSEGLSSVGTDARTGSSVTRVGDLDGDGIEEVLVGAPSYTAPGAEGLAEQGAAAVYIGGRSPEERTIADILFVGENAHDRAGVAVAGFADWNGDQTPDLFIGAEQINRSGELDPNCPDDECGPGRVYIVFFNPTDYPNLGDPEIQDVVSLSEIGNTIPGVVLEGESLGDKAGFALDVGEVTPGDGLSLLIGAPGRDVLRGQDVEKDAGSAYLVTDDLANQVGVVSLARVACSFSESCDEEGEIQGTVFLGERGGDEVGFSVAYVGNVVETGEGEIAIGAPGVDNDQDGGLDEIFADAGAAYLPSGPIFAGIIEVCEIGASTEPPVDEPVDGAVILGDQAGMALGWSVAAGGDSVLNGADDFLVGAPLYDVDTGEPGVDEVFADVGLVAQSIDLLRSGIIEVCEIGDPGSASDMATERGRLYVGEGAGDQLGFAIGGLLDVTGNGVRDIAFGAPFVDVDGLENAGVVYFVEGEFEPVERDFDDVLLGIIEVCEIGASLTGRQLSGTSADEEVGASVAGTGDVDGDDSADFLAGAPGRESDDGGVALVDAGNSLIFVPTNAPPVADASATPTPVECVADLAARVTLDGSLSSDPDSTPGTNDDIVSFEWFDETTLIATGEIAEATLGLGTTPVRLEVSDSAGLGDDDIVNVSVVDTAAPSGMILSPDEGECFGGAALPVVVADDFADTCDPNLTLDYSCENECPQPGGGPSYDGHGDYVVALTATDASGNAASDTVSFSIDTVLPTAGFLQPPAQTTIPDDLPFDILIETNDDDGALGDVVLEVVKLNGCVLYDGATYGDGDGLLTDEILPLNFDELCRLANECGITSLIEPPLTVEATDCGGNLFVAELPLRGSMALRPGVCTPVDIRLSGNGATVADWEPIESVEHYDVVRGDVANLAIVDDGVDLGAVECIESGSIDPSTIGNEDLVAPAPGSAFFYVVRSDDGEVTSSYGLDTQDRFRSVLPNNGDCL